MIVFYADNESFTLNFTDTNITLVEDNPFFFDYFVKNYSWPISKTIDDETALKLGLLDLDNATDFDIEYKGKLFIDNDFKISILSITDYEDGVLEGTISYGENTIDLFDTSLKDLPFPIVSTNSLSSHAFNVRRRAYPDYDYNFPMIIDETIASESNYENFEGIINKYEEVYLENSFENDVLYNRNIVTPIPYLMAILRTGFESNGFLMQGSFVSDKKNEKILLYFGEYLEKLKSNLDEDSFSFTADSGVWQSNVVTATHTKYINLTEVGTYTISSLIDLPENFNLLSFTIHFGGEEMYTATSNAIDNELIINVESSNGFGQLKIQLVLTKQTTDPNDGIKSIASYNKFEIDFSNGSLNVYPDSFSLSEVMPDMTFGSFLNRIKNWLNLEISITNNIVSINFLEQSFKKVSFKDETDFEKKSKRVKFNQNKIYKLIAGNESLFINKTGLVDNAYGYTDDNINEIDMDVEVLPIKSLDEIFTAYINEDTNEFKILFYDGLQNNLPVAIDNIEGQKYTLLDNYTRNWENWLNFRLNSKTYTDTFKANVSETFNVKSGRFKYNLKHIYKSIKRKRIKTNEWEYEIESETLN